MRLRTPCLLLLSLPLAGGAPAEVLERVVARVNGDIVTLSEFEQRQVAALQGARVGQEGVERYLRENNARILQEAIDDLLLIQRGQDLGVKVRPEYLEEIIASIKKDNNITSDTQFQEQLQREGLSLDELKRNIGRSIVRRQVLARELEPKAAIPDAEVLAEYEAHKADFQRPATVKLQEILVQGEGAQERARELAGQARGGADFAELARQNSSATSAKGGGELGTIARGELSRELDEAAFALAPGAVSEPIPSGGGYRVLKVVEKSEAGLVPYETARKEITQRLSAQRMAAEYEKYMEGLRKAAVTIDVRVREVPLQVALPEEPQPMTTAPAAAAPADPASGDEFATTPQAKPERVAPPGAPLEEAPRPDEPRPQPTPPPQG